MSYKAFLKIKEQMEIKTLKEMSLTEINALLNKLKDKVNDSKRKTEEAIILCERIINKQQPLDKVEIEKVLAILKQ